MIKNFQCIAICIMNINLQTDINECNKLYENVIDDSTPSSRCSMQATYCCFWVSRVTQRHSCSSAFRNLENNRIQFIPSHVFALNKNLRDIKLRGNPISSFGVNAFQGLPCLRELYELFNWCLLRILPNIYSGENVRD